MTTTTDRSIYSNQRLEYWLKGKLATDIRAAVDCLMIVFENQTLQEQRAGIVNEPNGIGFTLQDVIKLTFIANKIKRKTVTTIPERYLLLNRMPKYWRQYVAKKGESLFEERMKKDTTIVFKK